MRVELRKHGKKALAQPFMLAAIAILLPFYIGSPIIIGVLIYILWKQRPHILTLMKETYRQWLFILYCLIVSLVNNNIIGALVCIVFAVFVVYFYLYREMIQAIDLLKIIRILALGSIPLTVISLIVYLHYALTHNYGVFYVFNYAAIQTRAEATFFNANYYGLYCSFAILLAIYLMGYYKNKKWFGIGSFVIACNIISIILTASRWLLPTVAIAVIWTLSFINPKVARWGCLIFAGIALLLIIKPELMPRLENLRHGFEDRFALWEVGLKIFESQPLTGRGPLSYLNFYYLFTDEADMHAHSLYINTLADYGLIGTGLILWNCIGISRRIKGLYHKHRLAFALVTGFLVTILVHGVMDVAIFWVQTGFVALSILTVPIHIWEK